MPRGINWNIGELTNCVKVTSQFESPPDEVAAKSCVGAPDGDVMAAGLAYRDEVQKHLPDGWDLLSDGKVTGPRDTELDPTHIVTAARNAVSIDPILDKFGL